MKLLLVSLRPYLYKHRKLIFWGTVFTIVSNWFSIYPAQIVRHTFDFVGELVKSANQLRGFSCRTAVTDALYYCLPYFGLFIVLLALIRGFFLYLVRQTLIGMSRKIEYEQKNHIFEAMSGFSQTQLRSMKTGDMMARISEDVANVRMFLGPGIMYSLNTLTLFGMIIVTMIYVNPELTFYAILPLPLLTVSIYYVHSIIVKKSDEKQKEIGILSSFVQESFSGVRLIKAFAREKAIQTKFGNLSKRYKSKALDLIRVDAMFMPLIVLLIGISTILTVWVGSEKVLSGTITIGNIAEFVIYINLLIWPVTALGWVTSLTNKAVSGQKRINQILNNLSEIEYPETSKSPDPSSPYAIQLTDVNYTYPDTGIHAVKQFTLSLEKGKIYAVIGRTGSGKTTLLQLLMRVINPDSGHIELFGNPIYEYDRQVLSRLFSYVPQDVFLFSDTLYANIAFGGGTSNIHSPEEAAKLACVYDDIMSFPDKFDTKIGERGVTLSGGQKQRVSIARAFFSDSELLVMDDSLSAVDTKTEEEIFNNLRSEKLKNKTIIVVTHRISTAQKSDMIIVMDDGMLMEFGTHDELLQKHGLYYDFYIRQQLESEVFS
jgi:ATP-binding cassette subfamily B protein